MPLSQLLDDEVQVSLLATSGHIGLAIEMLSQRFGLSRQYAESVLDQGYGLLIPRLPKSEAREAVPMMSALGLRVAIQPVEAMPPDEFCDVSIRLLDPKYAPKLIATLERLLGMIDLTAATFGGPQGLVLPALSPGKAEWLYTALRPLPGVFAALSEHQSALYDLFSERALSEWDYAAVKGHLRLIGCAAERFGDSIGSGLERRALDRVLAQFPDLGLFGVNQAFQRHELLIIGKGSLSLQEFGDFLMTRPVAQISSARG